MLKTEVLEDVFGFHPATEETGPIHDKIRQDCRELAQRWNLSLADSREKSLALTKLQEAMMFANAAIAIHGPARVFGNEDQVGPAGAGG